MQLNPGTTLRQGKYTIEGTLGKGGFGITYLATRKIVVQEDLGEITTVVKVAIKEFFMKDFCNRDPRSLHISVPSVGSKELVEKYRMKFIKEANNIAGLRHPNIIKVFEVFEEKGTAYYVMEYVDGVSLNEVVAQQGALPESVALNYIRQVSAALDYIHQKRINHLDVKPANILLRGNNIVLIDFGLAKQYDEAGDQTSSTPVGISPGYAPLEQSSPGGVSQFSAPSDIYSLGATLYKLVVGKTPPVASDVLSDGIPALPAHLSSNVGNAIHKAMEPNRRSRPQSIKDFLGLMDGRGYVEERKLKEDVVNWRQEDKTLVKEEIATRQPERGKPQVNSKQVQKKVSRGVNNKKTGWWKTMLIGALVGVFILFLFWQKGQQPKQTDIDIDLEAVLENISQNMVHIQGGTFKMGSEASANEKPVHQVTLSSFMIGKYPVTQREWKAFMGSNPSSFKGDQLPVENVSWIDLMGFIRKLNDQTGKQFRLPTEAEWEFAARGGNSSKGYEYAGSNDINEVAWYSSQQTQPVGQKKANELGLYDMSGNVWEWCSDWYGEYGTIAVTNPQGPSTGSSRVLRGGSWGYHAGNCRSASRGYGGPGYRSGIGFRLAFSL